jgi:Fic family protein
LIDNLHIIPFTLLKTFNSGFDKSVIEDFKNLTESELSASTFSFYTSVSAVFSSKIEGEEIDLDSFIKHRRLGVKYKPDYTSKIDDLYDAYSFAQKTPLSAKALKQAHGILTKHILQVSGRGKYRKGNMFVLTKDGRIEYVAATPNKMEKDMNKLFDDIKLLLEIDLQFEETLFFASMIHLVFVKIHPFEDGDGRTARLLEKWFIGEKLGPKAWFIQSEKYYYDQHQTYYKNIRMLGLEYEELDYGQALLFLQMLPQAIMVQ